MIDAAGATLFALLGGELGVVLLDAASQVPTGTKRGAAGGMSGGKSRVARLLCRFTNLDTEVI